MDLWWVVLLFPATPRKKWVVVTEEFNLYEQTVNVLKAQNELYETDEKKKNELATLRKLLVSK